MSVVICHAFACIFVYYMSGCLVSRITTIWIPYFEAMEIGVLYGAYLIIKKYHEYFYLAARQQTPWLYSFLRSHMALSLDKNR